ncbi:MAG: hypothetical protein JXA23_07660 [Bacteroidales bacterium]|nr:hypothetical protein [Bacteroidales bacterium]
MKKWKYLLLFLFITGTMVLPQARRLDFSQAVGDVRTIGGQIAGILGGLIGLLGFGRAAYMFATGGDRAVQSLLMGIIGFTIGQFAVTML